MDPQPRSEGDPQVPDQIETPSVRVPRWRRPVILAATGAVVAAGLAAGGLGIADAATHSGAGNKARFQATSSTQPKSQTPSDTPGLPFTKPGAGPLGRRFGRGGFGGGFGFGFGFGAGTITQIGSSSVTIKDGAGKSVTVKTTSSTRYDEGGVPVSRSSLSVGERVAIIPEFLSKLELGGPDGQKPTTPQLTPASSLTAGAIEIILPSVGGKIVSISGSAFVVQDGEGFWRTVDVSTSTVYFEPGGKSLSESGLKVGDFVVASGDIGSDHTTLDAKTVGLMPNLPPKSPSGGSPFGGQLPGPGWYGPPAGSGQQIPSAASGASPAGYFTG
ncbi:MAG TPA: DUF5666 domain-containing protein [Acidimicrobiales bacterium]|nr:DUF5666 domain-containing protein [Acidimicrobiales bacterium]